MPTFHAAISHGAPDRVGPLTIEWTGTAYDTAAEAWTALADQRMEADDETDPWTMSEGATTLDDQREPGSVWLADAGHEGDDLHAGRTYTVTEA